MIGTTMRQHIIVGATDSIPARVWKASLHCNEGAIAMTA